MVAIVAADLDQAARCLNFIKGFISSVPMVARMVKATTAHSVTLSNNVSIETVPANQRLARGASLCAALLDEVAHWRSDLSSANIDADIVAALRPGLINLGGPLIMASTPYSRQGVIWDAFKDNWGILGADVLVWKGSSLEMNPSLPADVIAAAYRKDAADADAEYGANFRTDVASFVQREVVEAAVVPGRFELPYVHGTNYKGFVDPSGGSSDSFTLAISHRQSDRVILDVLRETRPPFSPEAISAEYAGLFRSYGIHRIRGDRYAGSYSQEPFNRAGVRYEPSELSKAEIYRDTLPLLNSGRI